MGKGKHWDAEENACLAKAFVHVSNDSILGTDQAGKTFHSAVHSNFAERGREKFGTKPVPPGKYGLRSLDSCRQHFADLSADVQKFWRSVTTVRNSCPTGTNEEDNLSMAIAIHLGKTSKMDYEYKTTDPMSWVNYLAFLVLKEEPKWAGIADVARKSSKLLIGSFVAPALSASDATMMVTSSTDLKTPVIDQSDAVVLSESSPNGSVPPEISHSGRKKRRGSGNVGRNEAKRTRREDIATRAVVDLARAMNEKNVVMEERNGILAFTSDVGEQTEEDKNTKAMYLRELRKIHLANLQARAALCLPPNGRESPEKAQDVSEQPAAPNIDEPTCFQNSSNTPYASRGSGLSGDQTVAKNAD